MHISLIKAQQYQRLTQCSESHRVPRGARKVAFEFTRNSRSNKLYDTTSTTLRVWAARAATLPPDGRTPPAHRWERGGGAWPTQQKKRRSSRNGSMQPSRRWTSKRPVFLPARTRTATISVHSTIRNTLLQLC